MGAKSAPKPQGASAKGGPAKSAAKRARRVQGELGAALPLGLYVRRVQQTVGEGAEVSDSARRALCAFAQRLLARIAAQAAALAAQQRAKTVGGQHARAAVKLVLNGELASNATAEGARACAKLDKSRG